MTKADIWMPVYVGDYVADTLHLTTEQQGAYWLLILACWKAGGELPDDDGQLAAITRLRLAKWRTHAAVLRPFFAVQGTKLIHRRVAAELARARDLSAKRSEAGKRGGRPRKSPQGESKAPSIAHANDKQTETNCFPFAEATGQQTETPSHSPSPPSSSKKESAASPPPARKRAGHAVDRPSAVSPEVLTAAGFDATTAAEFIAHKQAVKAPLTERAWADHCREAEMAGWTPQKAAEKVMAKNWKGFEAKYVAAETTERRVPASHSRHVGFDKLDFNEGITADGRIA